MRTALPTTVNTAVEEPGTESTDARSVRAAILDRSSAADRPTVFIPQIAVLSYSSGRKLVHPNPVPGLWPERHREANPGNSSMLPGPSPLSGHYYYIDMGSPLGGRPKSLTTGSIWRLRDHENWYSYSCQD